VHVAVLGAPGVGKGTFAARLSPLLGVPTVSSGDLIRDELRRKSAVGMALKDTIASGQLVADDVVWSLLRTRLSASDVSSRGFLLDGYPRRVSQAQQLAERWPVHVALNFTLDTEVLVEKALARRICAQCGSGYNLANIVRDGYDMPPLLPRVAGHCDKCAGKLITRDDDKEHVIRERLAIYQRETVPITEFYRQQGVLLEWSVKRGVQDLPEVLALLRTKIPA
jgi:adenylate kinase